MKKIATMMMMVNGSSSIILALFLAGPAFHSVNDAVWCNAMKPVGMSDILIGNNTKWRSIQSSSTLHRTRAVLLSSLRGGSSTIEMHDDGNDDDDNHNHNNAEDKVIDSLFHFSDCDDVEDGTDSAELDGGDSDVEYDDVTELEAWMFAENAPDDYEETTAAERSPITKAYIHSSFYVLFTLLEFQNYMELDWEKTLWAGQIWRPVTTFLILPNKIEYVWNLLFGFEFMLQLEALYIQVPYEFWIILTFGVAGSLAIACPILRVPSHQLGYTLLSYMMYIFCRYNEGLSYEIFSYTVGLYLLPWLLIASVSCRRFVCVFNNMFCWCLEVFSLS